MTLTLVFLFAHDVLQLSDETKIPFWRDGRVRLAQQSWAAVD